MLTEEDKEYINKNVKEVLPIINLKQNMKDSNEAPFSVTLTVVTPKGFSALVTLRGDELDLKALMDAETKLVEAGFKPQPVKTFGAFPRKEKTVEFVEGRMCPKCKNKLVYFESKGKKHIKCSTSKYDWTTKKRTGCNFLEWADSPKEQIGSPSAFPDINSATDKQKEFIIKLKTEGRITQDVNLDSLTKNEARELISSATGK